MVLKTRSDLPIGYNSDLIRWIGLEVGWTRWTRDPTSELVQQFNSFYSIFSPPPPTHTDWRPTTPNCPNSTAAYRQAACHWHPTSSRPNQTQSTSELPPCSYLTPPPSHASHFSLPMAHLSLFLSWFLFLSLLLFILFYICYF